MIDKRFEIEYDKSTRMVSINDKEEQVVVVLTLEQLEELIKWYCKEFDYIIM